MTPLLVPGETCATVFEGARGGLLVDGRDFYRAFYDAACQARHTILMTGWQFSSSVELVRGADAACCERPTRLLELLCELCKRRPELHVYVLAWNSSPVFTFEREPLQRLRLLLQGHPRIHWRMDNSQRPGASHHQKLIVIDRGIAFVGGMDVCAARWDDRTHAARVRERDAQPYHDVQSYLTGDAVDVLREWFSARWRLAVGETLELPACPREAIVIHSTFEVTAPRIALARTLPRDKIRELFRLHALAIGSAERLIYLENQYFSSAELADALEDRMRRNRDDRLEIVMILPAHSAGFKERISIGVYQAQLLERLARTAAETGHHLGVYYQVARGSTDDVPVYIHAKVLAVDDRFLLVSSANTSNRSMGFDTELGVAWESPSASASLRDARMELLAEHLGVDRDEAKRMFGDDPRRLVARLDDLASERTHQLRMHGRNRDERPGPLLERLLPDYPVFDPGDDMLSRRR